MKRYALFHCEQSYMDEAVEGDYVLYEDYKAIEDARDELAHISLSLTVDMHESNRHVQSIQAENDRLNASLAEARAERDRLREALKWIANGKLHTGLWLSDIARKALEGEGK